MHRGLLSLLGAAAAAATSLVGVVAGIVTAAPAAAATPDPGTFVSVTPVRALDTRTTGGALTTGQTRTLSLAARVPSATATAVVLNLTVTEPSAAGYLTVYPTDRARPTASSINKRAGETRSNSVTVALPGAGSRTIAIFNQVGSTHVVVDVLGYYDPAALFSGSAFYTTPLTPFRVYDSRTFTSGLDAGEVGDVIIPTPAGLTGVTAVAVNVTAVAPGGPGYLTLWSGSGSRPLVSTVNYGYDAVTPNFAVVPVRHDDDGSYQLTLQNMVSPIGGAVVDVSGYYAAIDDGGAFYVPVTPTRLSDTRTVGGPVQGGTTREFAIGGLGASARAVNLNVTTVDATTPTFVTVFRPSGSVPFVSTLNPFTPAAVANAAQPGLTSSGNGVWRYGVYNSQGAVQVVADLQGYFTEVAL